MVVIVDGLEYSKDSAEDWNNMGIFLIQKEKYEQAISAFDKAIKINPQYFIAWNNKGLALSHMKKYEEAISAFDKAMKINPQYYEAWHNRRLALAQKERNKEAISAWIVKLDRLSKAI